MQVHFPMKNKIYSFEPKPLHVIGKCPYGDWPLLPPDVVWSASLNHLSVMKRYHGVNPIAYVLMSNHFHLIAQPLPGHDQQGIEEFIYSLEDTFITLTGFDWDKEDWLLKATEFIPIDNIAYYQQAYHYLYRNPVTARIVDKVEDYPYSSLRYVLGKTSEEHPFVDNMHLITNPYLMLKWLNQSKELVH